MQSVGRRYYCRRSAKLQIFPHPTGLRLWNSGSRDTTVRVGYGMQAAKIPTYSLMCRFPLFDDTLRDYDQPSYRQTDRQTDGRTYVRLEA